MAVHRLHQPLRGALAGECLQQGELHEFIDRLQVSLARTNDELARIYFVGHSAPLADIAPIMAYQNQSQNQSQNQNKQISA